MVGASGAPTFDSLAFFDYRLCAPLCTIGLLGFCGTDLQKYSYDFRDLSFGPALYCSSIVPPLYASLAVSLYLYMICTLVGYIQLSQSTNSSPHLVSVCHWFRHSYITTYKICSSLKYFLEAGLVFICSRPELISAQILLTHHTSTTLEHWVPQAAHCKASLSHDPIV